MVFGNGVKNIQAAAYNGARTVSNFVPVRQKLYNPSEIDRALFVTSTFNLELLNPESSAPTLKSLLLRL